MTRASSTLYMNWRLAVNGVRNHMCANQGWHSKHPIKWAICRSKLCAKITYGHNDPIKILWHLPTNYQAHEWRTCTSWEETFLHTWCGCELMSTAHGLAPSIMACSLRPRHGSVLGQLGSKTSKGDGDQHPGQWCTLHDQTESAQLRTARSRRIGSWCIIIIVVVVLREGGEDFAQAQKIILKSWGALRSGIRKSLVLCIVIQKQKVAQTSFVSQENDFLTFESHSSNCG